LFDFASVPNNVIMHDSCDLSALVNRIAEFIIHFLCPDILKYLDLISIVIFIINKKIVFNELIYLRFNSLSCDMERKIVSIF